VTPRGTSFGRRAEDYERARPEYPPEALDLAVLRLELGPDAEVLDVGAGTGKLTRPLVERFRRVTAVEPDPGMRAVLTRATEAYRVLEGRAEAIPLPDDSVDAVFAGESFHWFDAGPALEEMARVLRPRGGVAVIWKHWWETEPPLPEAAARVLQRAFERPDLERDAANRDWRAAFQASPFGELREDELVSDPMTLDGNDLVTLMLTTSIMVSLPPEELADVDRELRTLVVGEYRLPIKSGLCTTRLTG